MLVRLCTTAALLVLFSIPASATIEKAADPAIAVAARCFSRGDYAGTVEACASDAGPPLHLLQGVALLRSGKAAEAETVLAAAADRYPLLRDYALYYRAEALAKLERHQEAAETLALLLRDFPESGTARRAGFLYAEELFRCGDYAGALAASRAFVEKYPSGPDSVAALFRSGKSLEAAGDRDGAAAVYRNIWINSPASPLATEAWTALTTLFPDTRPTADEILRRGNILYDLGKYDAALSVLSTLAADAPQDVRRRALFRKGQAEFRSRHYRTARETFAAITADARKGAEALFWQAKAEDKAGREEDAFGHFLQVAQTWPQSDLADDALMEAFWIRKGQGKKGEAEALLQRLGTAYPTSPLRKRGDWEIAWDRYLSGDGSAVELFARLALNPEYRERALYWQGKALLKAGKRQEADAAFARLAAEFGNGFYALRYLGRQRPQANCSFDDMVRGLPAPRGFERVRALLSLGLADDARLEAAYFRKKAGKKQRPELSLARLYLEMGDYHAALSLLKGEALPPLEASSLPVWAVNYPPAFSTAVLAEARRNGIAPTLVYSVMRAESSFSPGVVSPAGAVGLMQLLPSTARVLASAEGRSLETSMLRVPETNIRYGVRHLRDLKEVYGNDVALAIAAYNAGSGNVARWRKRFGALSEDEFIESIPFGETREYVKKVLAGAEVYSRLYGMPPLPSPTAAATAEAPPYVTPPAFGTTAGNGASPFPSL